MLRVLLDEPDDLLGAESALAHLRRLWVKGLCLLPGPYGWHGAGQGR